MSEHVWTIVVAAGTGARFGGSTPKQYVDLAGRRVLDHTLTRVQTMVGPNIVLVVAAESADAQEPLATSVVVGGATRSESVRAGLAAVPHDADTVFVHDAARPLLSQHVVDALLDALMAGADGAIPGIAVADTVKRVRAGFVVDTPPRAELVAVQTPQAFRAAVLRAVYASGGDATDDAALVEATGGRVAVVNGTAALRKVTTAADLAFLEGLLMDEQKEQRTQ